MVARDIGAIDDIKRGRHKGAIHPIHDTDVCSTDDIKRVCAIRDMTDMTNRYRLYPLHSLQIIRALLGR